MSPFDCIELRDVVAESGGWVPVAIPWMGISEGGVMDYFIVRHLRNGILAHTEDQYSVMSVEEIMADKNVELASEPYKTKSQAIAAMTSLK